jgi:hypothetical protein
MEEAAHLMAVRKWRKREREKKKKKKKEEEEEEERGGGGKGGGSENKIYSSMLYIPVTYFLQLGPTF